MAPKTRFTKQDIVLAAFDIAQTDGIESITIRKVAERLGSSIAPIYVNFNDAEELIQQVVDKTFQVARGLITEQKSGQPFRDIGGSKSPIRQGIPCALPGFDNEEQSPHEEYPEQIREVIGLMKLDPELAGFSDQELQSILLKMQTFQTGLCIMLANDLFTESVDDDKMIHMMDEAAQDFIRAARLRKQQEK